MDYPSFTPDEMVTTPKLEQNDGTVIECEGRYYMLLFFENAEPEWAFIGHRPKNRPGHPPPFL